MFKNWDTNSIKMLLKVIVSENLWFVWVIWGFVHPLTTFKMNFPDVPFTFGMNHFDHQASSAEDLGQHWTKKTHLHTRRKTTQATHCWSWMSGFHQQERRTCLQDIICFSKHPSPTPTVTQDLCSGCVAVYRRPGWSLSFLSRRHHKPQTGPPALEGTLTWRCPSPYNPREDDNPTTLNCNSHL